MSQSIRKWHLSNRNPAKGHVSLGLSNKNPAKGQVSLGLYNRNPAKGHVSLGLTNKNPAWGTCKTSLIGWIRRDLQLEGSISGIKHFKRPPDKSA